MTRHIRSHIWLRIAVIYFAMAVCLGVAMGATGNFTLVPVHAHLNLLGWVSMSLIGLIAARYPKLTEGRLAVLQFWLYNLGVPMLLASLAIELEGHPGIAPVVAMASVIVALGVLLFACQVFRHIKQ
jgi:hypothetical protein